MTYAVLAVAYAIGAIVFFRADSPWLVASITSRVLVSFGLPITATVIYLLFRSLWKHDTIRTGNGKFQATYNAIVLWVVLFVSILHAFVAAALVGIADNRAVFSRAVIFLFGSLFVAIGNLLPRTRPNIALGLRTKRTLASVQAWQQVHRVSGYAAVLFGAVTAIAAIGVSKDLLGGVLSLSAALALAAVVVSYRKYTRLA